MPLSIADKESKMSASLAIDAYTKTRKVTLSDEQMGHEVVRAALQRLQTSLNILLTSTDSKAQSKAFEVTILIIYYLQKTLDLITGGELAQNLFRLYEFCRLKVIECGASNAKGSKEIKACRDYISEISESWQAIQES